MPCVSGSGELEALPELEAKNQETRVLEEREPAVPVRRHSAAGVRRDLLTALLTDLYLSESAFLV